MPGPGRRVVTVLTDVDRGVIGKARELAVLSGLDAICAYTGKPDTVDALAAAFGRSQAALEGLIAIIDRLDSGACAGTG